MSETSDSSAMNEPQTPPPAPTPTAPASQGSRPPAPSVARRVIGEWTSSVLNTARTRAARQAAAAARVDIAAPGGSLDSMPLRPMSPREVDYARMSDDDIMSM